MTCLGIVNTENAPAASSNDVPPALIPLNKKPSHFFVSIIIPSIRTFVILRNRPLSTTLKQQHGLEQQTRCHGKKNTEWSCTSTEVRGDNKIVMAQQYIAEDDFFYQYASNELQELQEDKKQQQHRVVVLFDTHSMNGQKRREWFWQQKHRMVMQLNMHRMN